MIPSLLQIPSAVSDSKLHSVLPNNGKGDFTFDRSTGATRINKDGLIEEVGYFSSELVQNGNFSELGSELITPEANRDFSSNTGYWTLETGVTIGNGKVNFTEAANNRSFYKGGLITNGKTYKLEITISGYVEGFIDSNNGNNFTFPSSNGTHTVYFVGGNPFLVLGANGTTTLSIDNISVKQVDPNDRWTLGTGWEYGNGVASRTSQSGSSLLRSNSFTLTVGKTYKCTMTVSNYSNGGVRFATDNVGFTLYSANGTYTEILTSTGTVFSVKGNADFAGSVTNISVVEVQGDRPRLSYDITNGVVEDKPHLLLEPSSTNFVTFSEDFSQWTVDGEASISSDSIISPEGIKNSDKLIAGTTSGRQAIKLSSTNSGNLSFSIFAKKGEYSVIQLSDARDGSAFANFNLDTGAVGNSSVYTASIVDMGNDWYRCKISWNASLSIISIRVGIVTTPTSARVEEFSGNGSDGLYIYGAQLEEQAYCTSYIPTAGTTITRAAETCNNSKPSVNSTEGVLYCEIAALANDLSERQLSIDDETGNNRIIIRYNAVSNNINAYLFASSVQGGEFNYVSSDITQFSKIAFKWKANDFALWVDGVERATDTSGNTFSAGTLKDVSFDFNGNFDFYGKVKGLAVYNEALSESQLMQLTGVTASSIYSNFVTRTASFTVEALNEVKKVIDNL